jgi:hypothetical protein
LTDLSGDLCLKVGCEIAVDGGPGQPEQLLGFLEVPPMTLVPGELRPVSEDDAPGPVGPARWQPTLLHDAADCEAVPDPGLWLQQSKAPARGGWQAGALAQGAGAGWGATRGVSWQ